MAELDHAPPENIVILAERAQVHVRNKFGIEPDFTGETLSLLDHFVTVVLTEENNGTLPSTPSRVRHNMVELFAPTLGAYFGQTLARAFGGRWRRTDLAPQKWQFEFHTFFLRFNPIAAAATVLADALVDGYDAVLTPDPSLVATLEERLSVAPRVAEDHFFSFSNYFETIQIAGEFLLEVARKDGHPECSPGRYDLILGCDDPLSLTT